MYSPRVPKVGGQPRDSWTANEGLTTARQAADHRVRTASGRVIPSVSSTLATDASWVGRSPNCAPIRDDSGSVNAASRPPSGPAPECLHTGA
jgi:hypothetical protein